MFVLKGCPRCRGDLYREIDDELICLQCGYEVRPEDHLWLIARMEWELKVSAQSGATAPVSGEQHVEGFPVNRAP